MRPLLLILHLLPLLTGRASRRAPPLRFRLCELRQARGLSQQTLAERAGLSANYIWQLEHGARRPSVFALRKLAAGLEVDFLDLVAAESEP